MSCKPVVRIKTTEDYDGLTDLFIRNQLEFSQEEPVETDILHCWALTAGQGENEALIGGIALAKREGEYIIDGIAVEPLYRKLKLGKILLEKAVHEVKSLGGRKIFLVARAPEFFRKQGFITIPEEDAPNFFECGSCPQYGKSCFPEVMVLNID